MARPATGGGVLVLGASIGPPGETKPKDAVTRLVYSLDRVEIAPEQPSKVNP
jgi:hypothetical protein